MQYQVKFPKESKPAMPDLIYKGIQACNTWSNLWKEYKHAIPGQMY